jgi:hypothetical protein
MAELVELSNVHHKQLRITDNCANALAQSQQTLRIRVNEMVGAAANFPLFFYRDAQTGSWVLSILTSFENGHNLFMHQQQWLSTFQPTSIQTYPFFLMRKQENAYTIGIIEDSDAFSLDTGEPLFDDTGNASGYLSRAKTLLEADINNDLQTQKFIQKISQLNLLKAIDVRVNYSDESVNVMAGLHTIDEDKLQSLSAQQLKALNDLGYLVPIHSMLMSLYQINMLVRKNNVIDELKQVKQVKIEVAKGH